MATCIAPLDQAGFMSTIIPNDAAFNLGFILSNDPRPFYAHTSNVGGDRDLVPAGRVDSEHVSRGLRSERTTPNLTLTEVSATFAQQSAWTAVWMTDAPTRHRLHHLRNDHDPELRHSPVPLTAPTGTTVSGATLEAYGGELSGWVPAAPSTTGVVPEPPSSRSVPRAPRSDGQVR